MTSQQQYDELESPIPPDAMGDINGEGNLEINAKNQTYNKYLSNIYEKSR